jgi:hypothetical protein
MGAAWSAVKVEHAPRSHYWYRLVVLSRWSVRTQRLVSIHNGVAMAVTVDQPSRPIRILVVDGHSTITQLRTPMLHDVAQACRRAATAGTSFDLVAGDFNAVARSVGFDALGAVAGGYTQAAHASTGWRTTWPVPLPLYDIDHVWVRHGLILSCDLFANCASDHRGQLVRLALGDHRRAPARSIRPARLERCRGGGYAARAGTRGDSSGSRLFSGTQSQRGQSPAPGTAKPSPRSTDRASARRPVLRAPSMTDTRRLAAHRCLPLPGRHQHLSLVLRLRAQPLTPAVDQH